MRFLLRSVALCGLLACKGGDEASAPAPQPEPTAVDTSAEQAAPATADAVEGEAPEGPTQTQALMRGHFEKAAQAREALIRADIAGAKKAMGWLAEHSLGSVLPENVRGLQKVMQEAAGEFASAHTLREAGVALAKTLTKCGDCHSASSKGPTFAVPPLPEGEDAVHHMQRHHWAAQRMWEGLVKNDTEAFESAAQALADGPIDAKLLVPPAAAKKTVEQLASHLHELGKEAKAAGDADARAKAYGNFLATCATCHRLLGRGPKPIDEPAPTE